MKTLFTNKHFQIWFGLSVLLGLAIFWNSTNYPFLVNYDDGPLITNNLAVISLDIPRMFSEFVFGLYHPITTLSFGIDYFIFSGNAKGFHIVNIFIHILNGILCYALVLKLSNKKMVAGIAMLLFIIHPMHLESVVWLSERKDLLYSFFFLLACISYLQSLEHPKFSKWTILTFILFLFAVLSKSAAVVFPLVILLLDYTQKKFSFPKSILKTTPYFIVSILIGYTNILAQKSAGFITELPYFSITERIILTCYSASYYITSFFYPHDLSPKHFYPLEAIPLAYFIAPIIVLLFAFVAIKLLQNNRDYLFPIGFFILTIFLVLKIIPTGNDIVSDRYSYLPFLGLSMAIGLLIHHFLNSKNKNYIIGAGILVILGFTFMSYKYSKVWQNEIALWTYVIDKNPQYPTGYSERGRNYHEKKRYKLALKDLNKAINLDSLSSISLNQRGLTNEQLKHAEKAFNDYSKAIKLNGNFAEAYSNRGVLLSKFSRTEEGIIDIKKAIKLKPGDADYYNNLGIAYAQLTKWDSAKTYFNKCLVINPLHSNGKMNLKRLNNISK